jgi:hypothetical protein
MEKMMARPAKDSLRQRRERLLAQLGKLSLLLHGSYLERFSACARPTCACHDGRKHGPRSYLVIYRRKRQRQVYIPEAQRRAVRRGLRQYQELGKIVQQLTDLNLRLLRTERATARERLRG